MAQILFMLGAIALTLPGVVLRLSGAHVDPLLASTAYGLAVVGSAFLLSWAAEVAQHDIPRALALTILALIAVLPEYAVDMYLAWRAAEAPAEYGPLALVNMTGANRLLIGVGWPLVVFLYWLRARRDKHNVDGVAIDPSQANEVSFLALATLYSFVIPLKGTLSMIDLVILIIIFGFYAWQVAKAEQVEPDLIGPARVIGELADTPRRVVTALFFIVAGMVIYLVAEPFAESLIEAGTELGMDRRTLVQWLAPLASEAPEFIITSLFAWRLLGAAALGALVSSKVNQWTLLVGTIPLVFNIASWVIGNPIPTALHLDSVQREDLLLTSAQSLFAVAMLLGLHLSLLEAALLFFLFIIQFIFPGTHLLITGVYILLAIFFGFHNRVHIAETIRAVWGKHPSEAATK